MRKFSDTLTSLFDAVVDPPTPESRRTMNCELAAGAAVDRGALLAGPLAKRSEWLHAWNVRFCSLFTSHFTWQRTSSAAEGRAVPLQSAMAVAVRDECLCVQLLAGPHGGHGHAQAEPPRRAKPCFRLPALDLKIHLEIMRLRMHVYGSHRRILVETRVSQRTMGCCQYGPMIRNKAYVGQMGVTVA